GESTRAYGRLFPMAIKELETHNIVVSLCSFLAGRGWPDDDVFAPALMRFEIYRRESGIARILLTALEENFGHREAVDLWRLLDDNTLQIEHVLPQGIDDSLDDSNGAWWREVLGDEWQRVHGQLVQTCGKLTLTGYNHARPNRA